MNKEELKEAIGKLKKEKNAVIMAHYYQRPEIQEIADVIGDSLALARRAAETDADIIVLCGVNFMGETAKILSPEKRVLVPTYPHAGCSLADSCNAADFRRFIEEHPGHTVVSYVNTTAAVKALTDVVCTSGNARKVVESLPKDEKIIFGPDKNLGAYINKVTGRNMLLWDGACHVHDRFSPEGIMRLKEEHPAAKVLVHPECKGEVEKLADCTGSTAALLDYARNSGFDEFIVVTESGILVEMEKKCPGKKFYPAPARDSVDGCNCCEYMRLNTLENVYDALLNGTGEINVDPAVAKEAVKSIRRMLEIK